jgi:hypothetical protein
MTKLGHWGNKQKNKCVSIHKLTIDGKRIYPVYWRNKDQRLIFRTSPTGTMLQCAKNLIGPPIDHETRVKCVKCGFELPEHKFLLFLKCPMCGRLLDVEDFFDWPFWFVPAEEDCGLIMERKYTE